MTKQIIFIVITFVLLVPTAVFAQEGSRNMMEEYCLKNLQDDPQCENFIPKKIEQNKIEQNKIEPPKASNPFEDFIQFIFQIFQGINPEETMNDVSETIKDTAKEIPQIDEIQTQIEEKYSETLKGIEENQIKLEKEQKISDEKYLKDIASKIHVLINEERTTRGLSPLSWNPTIAKASVNHSDDMANRGYFEHDSPEGRDFTWRYSQVGFTCSISQGNWIYGGAENIMYTEGYYGVDTIAIQSVDGWMDSSGHRANILTPYFKSEGIGVAKSGSEVYVTQNFC
ncbi:MAG: CAP domain-containing protein [Nitrosopumilus sp.]|nr:CAP domain-containing protein [Nitrosopumilus sp.]